MREYFKKIPGVMRAYNLFIYLKNYARFVVDYIAFKKQTTNERFVISWSKRKVVLGENTPNTHFDRHYIYHPAWAARVLAETKPIEHIDISSTLTFCSIVSAFIPIKFYDYRPAKLNISNLTEDTIDLLKLPFADNSLQSISCMHTVEHVGLGRYGEPIDPDGDLHALAELERVLAVGGNLLVVMPVGQSKIQFNAHRIYSYRQIVESLQKLTLKEFSLIPDNEKDGGIIKNAPPKMVEKQTYACGCFWFTKK